MNIRDRFLTVQMFKREPVPNEHCSRENRSSMNWSQMDKGQKMKGKNQMKKKPESLEAVHTHTHTHTQIVLEK